MSKYDLRYQVAVYSEDGATLLVAPQTQVVDTYGPVSFEFSSYAEQYLRW